MTIHRITETLQDAGIEDALWEALLLAEHFTGRNRNFWRADRDTEIPSDALADAVAKRCTRYPLQYILGFWEFMGLEFTVREGCLIPRPDTEILVEKAIALAEATGKPALRILDLCTGSGCILASVLHYVKNATGTAVDLYPAALAVAEENFRNLHLSDRAQLIAGDIRNILLPEEDLYDLILSNPPYVTAEEMETLEPELSHEPSTALTDGGNGLSLYEAIFRNYLPHLADGGTMILEHGADQSEAVLCMGRKYGMTGEALQDYSGHNRCALLRRTIYV